MLAESTYLGKRLTFNNVLCTVRYCGPLPGQPGDWLGIEWDEPDRGKHNGEYKGTRLFSTLSNSPSCASFIRATRRADTPRGFLQALRYKYAEQGLEHSTIQPDGSIEISGKVVEEVGFERIRQQQALLHELRIVLLDGLHIRGLEAGTEIRMAQEEIESTCPIITELDLSRNLFEHWRDLVDICTPLTKLRVLKAR
jgi:tubulin-specific chaperone E